MNVDWQTYYDAARQCRQLADDLRKADKPVHDAIRNGCNGMADDANGCTQWGQSYDKAAHTTLQACASLANALTNYGAVLYAQGFHWGNANKSNPPKPDTSQVSQYTVDLPTSVRDNGAGFEHSGGVKAFFDKLVIEVANKFGKLPNGDAAKLKSAHTTWNTFATHETLTGAAARISTLSGLFDGMDDATNRQLIQDHFATLETSADNIVTGAQNIAAPIGQYHDATVSFGETTASKINWLEAGIAAAAVAGIALAIFTVGMSVEVAAEGITAAVAATITAIEEAFSASSLVEILGVTTLAIGAVATVKAFEAVPVNELEKDAAKLAAIIAMKVLIDEDADASGGTGESAIPGNPTNEAQVKEYLKSHTEKGKNPPNRQVATDEEMVNLYDELTKSGTKVDPGTYPGRVTKLPDGTELRMRDGSLSGGRTIDIKYPNGKIWKVHLP
ncbi:hypothetical protein C5E45_23010 [Nocardia nova]|uniref:Bacterial toxin 24 domain-containing protein n=1 Tax=Nocardia nova TaxID=37330 RepID=A0A2S6AL77_9NOCA|nr:hypothetical protein [Nocardia nova]PPJ35972.1 hypothetical protein C5E45_23010 [Nocardia nova]